MCVLGNCSVICHVMYACVASHNPACFFSILVHAHQKISIIMSYSIYLLDNVLYWFMMRSNVGCKARWDFIFSSNFWDMAIPLAE